MLCASLTRLVAERVHTFDSIESWRVDVVNVKEIWKLLVDNVTVLRQYVLSYR